jgi:DNA repair protein RadD
MKLRPYQNDSVRGLRAALREVETALLTVPTGGGKTIIAASMINSAARLGKRCVFLAHRKELIDQTVDKLQRWGVVAGVIMGDDHRKFPLAPVQVCTTQTLSRRLPGIGTIAAKFKQGPPPAELVIFDEAHHAMSDSARALVKHYVDQGAKIIGLTATPWRADKLGLGDVFQKQIVACTPQELIASGALVDYDAFAYDAPDLHNVRVTAGDFNQKDLALAVNTDFVVGNVVKEYLTHAKGRPSILFPVGIAHSLHFVKEFTAAGVPAAHIDFETPKAEREASIRGLSDGSILILSSVGVLTEGFDCPRAEGVIIARPTMSLPLWLQMVGRGLRPVPCEGCRADYVAGADHCPYCGVVYVKTRALIHDHGGNLLRHGLPDDPARDYSMHATSQRVTSLHTCPKCRKTFAALKDRKCPHCGEILAAPDTSGIGLGARGGPDVVEATARLDKEEVKARRGEAEAKLDLKLRRHLTPDQVRQADEATPAERRAEYRRLLDIGEARKFSARWPSIQYRATFGEWPRWKVLDMAGVIPATLPFFPEGNTAAPDLPPPPDSPPEWWHEREHQ